MVRLACVVHGTNYCARGRTIEDMGLKGLRVSEVKRYVQEGKVNPVYVFADDKNGRLRRSTTIPVQ
jgi:hypothetical protein